MRRTLYRSFLPAAFLVAACLMSDGTLAASPLSYYVVVNTSGFTGLGNIDFQFNPGALPGSDEATAVVSEFQGAGVLGSPVLTGDASGTLSLNATASFDNQTVFNDFFQEVNFGNVVTFVVTLDGTAIENPSANAADGSVFAVGFFDNTANQNPLVGDDGIAGRIDINPGTASVSTEVFGAGPNGGPIATITPVPEPATTMLAGLALGLMGVLTVRSRRINSHR